MSPPSFLSLPLELRFMIYRHLLVAEEELKLFLEYPLRIQMGNHTYRVIPFHERQLHPAILHVCRQTYIEAISFLYGNTFTIDLTIATGHAMTRKAIKPNQSNALIRWCKQIKKNAALVKRLRLQEPIPRDGMVVNPDPLSAWTRLPVALGLSVKPIRQYLKNVQVLEIALFFEIPDLWVEPVERLVRQLKALRKVAVINHHWPNEKRDEALMFLEDFFRDIIKQRQIEA
ncbi:hypothetical protein MMC14_005345 [Varicellaria rhodocarpa]|nr:hypothetical protein [Varicellaria rhodocarpa]